ncbi:M20/M25/M40 family metallo-hydrolase [Georgenia yuyongxinii]|uniref:M20/M25/M40 family metallo-hydrolase n=1 Tax=Georgenia yuyongxinii TaxID=2589797 RepID=A0A5B8C0Q2_9MICO|nr:M20/M25/M40 family metallo-hydrolase [Georgenia yuyongxinii]QDC24299.1 M20/M25/M40 family metallo-hydrolase [Georgenia yuyongxinii]
MQIDRRRLAALSAATILLTTAAATPALAKPNPNNSKKLTRAVTVEAVHDHLEAFQALADEYDNRASGTPGYEAGADYVEAQLRAAGYEPQRQYFEFDYWELQSATLEQTAPVERELAGTPMEYSPSAPAGGVSGELAAPAGPQGCDAAAYAGADLTGKIALVQRGTCAFSAKAVAAGAAGAAGVIIYNNGPGELNGTYGGLDDAQVPGFGITQELGQELLGQVAAGAVTVNLDVQAVSRRETTFNVIAETGTGRSDNVVMLGAHLDGVIEGPGINDNGSGSAAILETAIQLAEVNKLNNKVRFAWWGAEENGLLGSWHYVDDLVARDQENGTDELGNIATYLNFDMVASPNHVIGVYDADESTHEAPVEVPTGSAESEAVFTGYFDRIGQAWVDTEFSGRSDYQSFISNGVPASGLFTGADGVKTLEEVTLFGGTAGITYDPNYHTAQDDLANVDLEALDVMSDAIAHAAITLAQDTAAINGKHSAGKSGKPHPRELLPVGDHDAA